MHILASLVEQDCAFDGLGKSTGVTLVRLVEEVAPKLAFTLTRPNSLRLRQLVSNLLLKNDSNDEFERIHEESDHIFLVANLDRIESLPQQA